MPKSTSSSLSRSSGIVTLARSVSATGGPGRKSSFVSYSSSPSLARLLFEAKVTTNSTVSGSGSPGSLITFSGSTLKPSGVSAALSSSNETGDQPMLRTRNERFFVEPYTTLSKSST